MWNQSRIVLGGKRRSRANMLKLVESLAIKAERAKPTNVQFFPLRAGFSHRCSWCGTFAKGNPITWDSFTAFSWTGTRWVQVVGDVCADQECQLSTQAKFSFDRPSLSSAQGRL